MTTASLSSAAFPLVGAIPPIEIFTLYLPLAGMAFGLVVVVLGMWTAVQNRRMKHETIRIALEKGQPIPAGLGNDYDDGTGGSDGPQSPQDQRWARHQRSLNDLRGGLVCIAVAGGLYFIVPFVAPMMGFIGLALLICWFIGRRGERELEKRD